MLTYEFLANPEEASPLFAAYDFPMPDPRVSQFIGIRNEQGEVVGVVPMQLVFHAEPVIVKEEARAALDWKKLQAMCDTICAIFSMPGYVAIAQGRNVEFIMRQRLRMTELTGTVFLRDIRTPENQKVL